LGVALAFFGDLAFLAFLGDFAFLGDLAFLAFFGDFAF